MNMQVGARFMANQTYLVDLIHPGKDVGLEIGNIYLNLAAQAISLPSTQPLSASDMAVVG